MRTAVGIVLSLAMAASGCASSYRIPGGELQRIAAQPPESRGYKVRVVQDILESGSPGAERVEQDTQIILVPNFHISVAGGPRRGPMGHGGGHVSGGGGGKSGGGIGGGGGSAGDGKGLAIAAVVVAASVLVAAAAVEGSRYDGWAQLHPMHPVHLTGRDGSYLVMPLAWIDAETAAWTRRATVRRTEGPWRSLGRAPLDRAGATYGMYAGTGSLRSAYGDLELGTAFTIQLGYFPTQELGVVGSVFFGWRDNRMDETLFESRYTLELQALPLQLGRLHAGVFGGLGGAYRFEDGVRGGDSGSGAFTGGTLFQLDVNTRIAVTARLGVARAHDELAKDISVGLAVY